jgi:hypothetical protein
MQLKPHRSRRDLLPKRFREARVAFAQKTQIHGKGFSSLQHALNIPGSGSAGGRIGSCRRPGSSAYHRRHSGHQRFFDLLWANEVNVRVDRPRGRNQAFSRDDLARGSNHNINVRLDVGVAGFADSGNAAILDRYVGLDDSPVIHDQRVGDHGVGALGGGALALAHSVANDLPTAEFDFLSVGRKVLLDLDPKFGVRKPHPISHRRTVHFGVSLARDFHGLSSTPMTAPLKP